MKNGPDGKKYLALKNRIFLGNVIVAVGILTALWFIFTAMFYDAMIERIRADNRKMLSSMNRNLHTVMTTVEDYSRVIASAKGLQENISDYLNIEEQKQKYFLVKLQASLAEAASDIIHPTTIADGMAVFIGTDVVYSGYDISEQSVYEIMEAEEVEEAYERQRPVWGELEELQHNSPYSKNESVFPISKLIRNKNTGQSLGVVTLFVRESYLCDIYANEENDEYGSRYYITNGEGQVMSSSDKEELFNNIADVLGISNAEYEHCIQEGELFLEKNGIPVLYSSIESRLGWRMFSVTVLNDLVREQKRMQILLLAILITMLLLLLCVSYAVARTVTKPVYQLLRTMHGISEAEMTGRVEAKMKGEMGLLAEEFNLLMDRVEESRRTIYREQQSKRKNELKLLQSQINPHFLYNTMETISSLIKLHMEREALSALKSLSEFYRLSLSNGKEMISVEEEIRLTENYLKLQSMRYVECMEYRICIGEEMYGYQIPKLTIQPLVENAIYHGIKESGEKGILLIEGNMCRDRLHIIVYDTGKGIPPLKLKVLQDSLEKGEKTEDSFGLGSVVQRLQLLYGNNCKVRIESVYEKFTEVMISVPAERMQKKE